MKTEYHAGDGWAEGWDVFATDREDGLHLEIQRLDDPQACGLFPDWTEPLFESDEAAVEHVRKRAAEGSAMHAAALRLHGTVEKYQQTILVRAFSPAGPCLTLGRLKRMTPRFYVYDEWRGGDRYEGEKRVARNLPGHYSRAHVEPCRSCRDHPRTQYPNGYMD